MPKYTAECEESTHDVRDTGLLAAWRLVLKQLCLFKAEKMLTLPCCLPE